MCFISLYLASWYLLYIFLIIRKGNDKKYVLETVPISITTKKKKKEVALYFQEKPKSTTIIDTFHFIVSHNNLKKVRIDCMPRHEAGSSTKILSGFGSLNATPFLAPIHLTKAYISNHITTASKISRWLHSTRTYWPGSLPTWLLRRFITPGLLHSTRVSTHIMD